MHQETIFDNDFDNYNTTIKAFGTYVHGTLESSILTNYVSRRHSCLLGFWRVFFPTIITLLRLLLSSSEASLDWLRANGALGAPFPLTSASNCFPPAHPTSWRTSRRPSRAVAERKRSLSGCCCCCPTYGAPAGEGWDDNLVPHLTWGPR